MEAVSIDTLIFPNSKKRRVCSTRFPSAPSSRFSLTNGRPATTQANRNLNRMTKLTLEMRLALGKTRHQKPYTQEQVAQLIAAKDNTIRWLNYERQNLEKRETELQSRLTKVNEALELIQQLSNERKDLAVFERMQL